MPDVSFTINGRRYEVSCNPGEEAHLVELAAHVDRRVSTLSDQIGQIGEMRLLVMGALLVADELSDALARMSRAEAEAAELREALAERDRAHAAALAEAAARAERLAADLEGT